MARYIDAEKIPYDYTNERGVPMTREIDIQNVRTADVRPNVRGEWLHEQLIPNTIEGKMYGECSVCHKVRIVDNFCPNCGALMSESLKCYESAKAFTEGLLEGFNCGTDMKEGAKNE